jgi:hypothetical protein
MWDAIVANSALLKKAWAMIERQAKDIGGAKSPVPGFISSCDICISLRRDVFKDTLHLLQCITAIDFSIPQILL